MSAATTWPPSARIRNTQAWPIPEPPPVISTLRLANRDGAMVDPDGSSDTVQLLFVN
jgi:hypothetical protein